MNGPVLVTGGAGSVGRLVVNRLLKNGHTVRVFDLPSLDFGGLEGKDNVQIVKGDITRQTTVAAAVEGVRAVVHLAALLPPVSERDRTQTFRVNVEGTRLISEELARLGSTALFVFSSSVSTFGDTSKEDPPVMVDHPQTALDVYAESKIAAEKCLRELYPAAVILRISGVAVSSIQEPPEVWPFMADQRIEFVHRDDVVTALCAAAIEDAAKGMDFIIAGGPSWRLAGGAYVKDYYDILGVPIEDADFQDLAGWCDWYDTEDSEALFHYQSTPYSNHIGRIEKELGRLMAQ